MKDIGLRFFFEGVARVELVKSEVRLQGDAPALVCVRGKTSGAYSECGSFQWTSGVRGVCVVLLRYVLSQTESEMDYWLSGGRSSLAASLDYALSKGPSWLGDMFGTGRNGSLVARRLFKITNPNRKRPGPVVISVNNATIKASSIDIFYGGRKVVAVKDLQNLLTAIESQDAENDDSFEGTLKKASVAGGR